MALNKNIKYSGTFIKYFLTIIILLDFMGLATVVVLFPSLFLTPSDGLFLAWLPYTSRLMALGICLAVYPLGQFIGSSFFGNLSDTNGRKKMLTLTVLGTIIGFVMSAVSIDIVSYKLLVISRLFTGFCAGNVAIAQASLIDISDNKTKASNLSLAQMAMGLAYVVGPTVGAILTNSKFCAWFGPSTSFWVFALLMSIVFIVLLVFYQETLSTHSISNVVDSGRVRKSSLILNNHILRNSFIVWAVFVAGWWLFESFMPSFLLQKFHLNTSSIGYILSFNGAVYALFQYLVVQRVANKLRPTSMVLYSLIFAGISVVTLAFITSVLQIYLVMTIFVLTMGFCIPGLITSISNLVTNEQQGQIMGLIGSIQAITTVLVMLAGGIIQSLNVNITIIAGGVLMIISWLLFTVSYVKSKHNIISTIIVQPEGVDHE